MRASCAARLFGANAVLRARSVLPFALWFAALLLPAESTPAQVQAQAQAQAYDPLSLAAGSTASAELRFTDARRQRELPLKIYLPSSDSAAPVVLFSHGLGGNREGSAYLGRHWAARGYLAVFLQHPGSDDSVWKDVPAAERMPAMRRAASIPNTIARILDVPAVIDQLERWQDERGHPLFGRLDLSRIGLSGHSFGALTTQSLSGMRFANGQKPTEPRLRAAVIMSPSGARDGADSGPTFGSVSMPWLLMTGTLDTFPIGNVDIQSRFSVFPALPTGDKFELVLNRAEHSAFTDRALPGDREPRNPNHHRAILATSTAFWDAYLLGNASARQWLTQGGARAVLEPDDRWQWK